MIAAFTGPTALLSTLGGSLGTRTPDGGSGSTVWILSSSSWDDAGGWDDDETWND